MMFVVSDNPRDGLRSQSTRCDLGRYRSQRRTALAVCKMSWEPHRGIQDSGMQPGVRVKSASTYRHIRHSTQHCCRNAPGEVPRWPTLQNRSGSPSLHRWEKNIRNGVVIYKKCSHQLSLRRAFYVYVVTIGMDYMFISRRGLK